MKRQIILTVGAGLCVVAAGGVYAYRHLRYGRNTIPQPYYQNQSNTSTKSTSSFNHVFIILEENKSQRTIMGNVDAPYINSLAKQFAIGTNYNAVTNPSLPNYLALTSGSTNGLTNDCNPPGAGCAVNVPNIADKLEQSGRTWKEYAESMPGPCYAYNSGGYVTKHNPFLYYTDILMNSTRCKSHVVPLSRLSVDLNAAKSTPNYAFITPNLCNDMHDCAVSTGDKWLAQQVPPILSSPAFTNQKSLLVIMWDEGNNTDNRVPIIFAGSAAQRGYQSSSYYSHYSLLHTIEDNWKIRPLTQNDARAPLMTAMLR